MPDDVVVLFVHGINTTCQDYYEPLRDGIVRQLGNADAEHAVFRSVFWADIVRGRQQEYWNYAKQTKKLKPHPIHKMVLEGLGDAAAYQKTEQRKNSAYFEIQGRLRKALTDAALPGLDNRPLVIIAHSLGCHIVSTFAWDLHKFKYPDAYFSPLEIASFDSPTRDFVSAISRMPALAKLDTFAGFVTMGCNMPLFTFTFGPQHVFPITRLPPPPHSGGFEIPHAFPGAKLAANARQISAWQNYYSNNDPFGYPLKPLNDAYDDEDRLTDIQTRSESHAPKKWWESLALLPCGAFGIRAAFSQHAHVGYWHDPTVAGGAARLIRNLIHAEGTAPPVQLFPDLPPTP